MEYVRNLLKPFRHSVRKLADPGVTVHEKRKTLKKAQVGEGVLTHFDSFVNIFNLYVSEDRV